MTNCKQVIFHSVNKKYKKVKMSLKPKRVDFDTTWASLKETVKGVITFSNVPRATWNDRFTGKFSCCNSTFYIFLPNGEIRSHPSSLQLLCMVIQPSKIICSKEQPLLLKILLLGLLLLQQRLTPTYQIQI